MKNSNIYKNNYNVKQYNRRYAQNVGPFHRNI